MCKIFAIKGPGQKIFSLMYFFMYWKLKFQISAHLKEKSRKIEKISYGSQMFAENTLCVLSQFHFLNEEAFDSMLTGIIDLYH